MLRRGREGSAHESANQPQVQRAYWEPPHTHLLEGGLAEQVGAVQAARIGERSAGLRREVGVEGKMRPLLLGRQ